MSRPAAARASRACEVVRVRFASRRRQEEPLASYAGILDGRHLWLYLEGDGMAELRDSAGTTYALTGPVTDLLALLPAVDATYDVVLAGAPVRGGARPAADPTRVPVSSDGLTQLGLELTEAGHLLISRRGVPATALLEAIELRDADVHLTIRPVGELLAGTHLVLLDADDQVLDQLPITAHDGHVEALVGIADLPAGYFGIVRLALGADTTWARIRRRSSDLADPHQAVLLPELHDHTSGGAEEDLPRARFRWNPDSHLVLRVLDPAQHQDGPGATVTPMASRL